MKNYKQQFVSLFLLLLSNVLFSQDKEWSEWKCFPVFEELKTRNKIKPEGDFYQVNIQCTNDFSHDLVVILELLKHDGKTSVLKLNVSKDKPLSTSILLSERPKGLINKSAFLKPQWEVLNMP